MKIEGLKNWPHPGNIIRNGTLVVKTKDNKRIIMFRGRKGLRKEKLFWITQAPFLFCFCEIQCFLSPFSLYRWWYYFEKEDMLRCIEALEADGSFTATGSSGPWETDKKRNKLGKRILHWMTNLCVLRMNLSFRGCENVLSEKWDKILSIACIGETPSSLGLGSWVKAKDSQSLCVLGLKREYASFWVSASSIMPFSSQVSRSGLTGFNDWISAMSGIWIAQGN